MEFEREFIKTHGVSTGPWNLYEAKKLHRESLHVRSSLKELNACE